LAYRYKGDIAKLVEEVVRVSKLPVICAGSIDGLEKIGFLESVGVWGFTIGGAIFDHRLVPDGMLIDQINAVLQRSVNITLKSAGE